MTPKGSTMLRSTKSLLLATTVCILLLSAPPARSDEPTLLDRLSAETTALAERARRATVRVTAGAVTTEAVLVGEPPRLVTPYAQIGAYEEIRFALSDGTSGTARRLAAERELDVAVYALPEDAARRASGLVTEARWALPPGRIAVLAGERPRLLLTADARGPRDGLRVGEEDATGVLLAADGTLLGFRPAARPSVGHYPTSVSWGRPYPYTVASDGLTVLYRLASGATVETAKPLVTTDGGKTFKLLVTPTLGDSLLVLGAPPPAAVLGADTFLPGALIDRVLRDLDAHGRVRHAYLGVVPAAAAEGGGARLVTVVPDSPAARAGLAEGDVVTGLDGDPVADVAAFTRQLVLRAPGESVVLTVRGRDEPVRVVLAAQEDARTSLPTPEELGFEVTPLSPELRAWLEVDDAEEGVVVRSVKEGGSAARAGLRRGDLIVKGGEQPTRDAEELLAALAGAESRIALTVGRGGSRLVLVLLLPAPKPGSGPR